MRTDCIAVKTREGPRYSMGASESSPPNGLKPIINLKGVKYQATETLAISKQRTRASRCPCLEPLAYV